MKNEARRQLAKERESNFILLYSNIIENWKFKIEHLTNIEKDSLIESIYLRVKTSCDLSEGWKLNWDQKWPKLKLS